MYIHLIKSFFVILSLMGPALLFASDEDQDFLERLKALAPSIQPGQRNEFQRLIHLVEDAPGFYADPEIRRYYIKLFEAGTRPIVSKPLTQEEKDTKEVRETLAFLGQIGEFSLSPDRIEEGFERINAQLTSHPEFFRESDSYWDPVWKILNHGLEDWIGGHFRGETRLFSLQRKGGRILQVNVQGSLRRYTKSPFLEQWRAQRWHLPEESTNRIFKVFYYDDEYIGHNDWDFFRVEATLRPGIRQVLSDPAIKKSIAQLIENPGLSHAARKDLILVFALLTEGPEFDPYGLTGENLSIFNSFLSRSGPDCFKKFE